MYTHIFAKIMRPFERNKTYRGYIFGTVTGIETGERCAKQPIIMGGNARVKQFVFPQDNTYNTYNISVFYLGVGNFVRSCLIDSKTNTRTLCVAPVQTRVCIICGHV